MVHISDKKRIGLVESKIRQQRRLYSSHHLKKSEVRVFTIGIALLVVMNIVAFGVLSKSEYASVRQMIPPAGHIATLMRKYRTSLIANSSLHHLPTASDKPDPTSAYALVEYVRTTVIPPEFLEFGLGTLDTELLFRAAQDYAIDLLIEYETGNGGIAATEVLSRLLPNLEIHTFDTDPTYQLYNQTQERLEQCCPNVTSHVGQDSLEQIPRFIEERLQANVGVFLDGHLGPEKSIQVAYDLLGYRAVRFVAIHNTAPKWGFLNHHIAGAFRVSTWQVGYRNSYQDLSGGATNLTTSCYSCDLDLSLGNGMDLFVPAPIEAVGVSLAEKLIYVRKMVDKQSQSLGMMPRELQLPVRAIRDYGIDLLIESGTANGLSTETWARIFPNLEIHTFDVDTYHLYNRTRTRLSRCCPNVVTHLGDSLEEIPKFLSGKARAVKNIGIVIDGPKAKQARNFAELLMVFSNVRFVALHGTAPKWGYDENVIAGATRVRTWEPDFIETYEASLQELQLPENDDASSSNVWNLTQNVEGTSGLDLFTPVTTRRGEMLSGDILYVRANTVRRLIPKESQNYGMNPHDVELVLRATNDYDIDLLVESGTANGVSTETVARTFPNLEIHTYDLDAYHVYNRTKARLELCCPNVTMHLGDSTIEIPRLIESKPGAKIGIVIDGPKDQIARDFAETLFTLPADIRFITIHSSADSSGGVSSFGESYIAGTMRVSSLEPGYLERYESLNIPLQRSDGSSNPGNLTRVIKGTIGLDLFVADKW